MPQDFNLNDIFDDAGATPLVHSSLRDDAARSGSFTHKDVKAWHAHEELGTMFLGGLLMNGAAFYAVFPDFDEHLRLRSGGDAVHPGTTVTTTIGELEPLRAHCLPNTEFILNFKEA